MIVEKYFKFDKKSSGLQTWEAQQKNTKVILRHSIVKLLKVKEIVKAAEKNSSSHTKEQWKDYQLTSLPKWWSPEDIEITHLKCWKGKNVSSKYSLSSKINPQMWS